MVLDVVRTCILVALAGTAAAQGRAVLTVAPPGSVPAGQYTTIEAAVQAAPATGGVEIRIAPGIYREVVHVDKPDVRMMGEGSDPGAVEVVYDDGTPGVCGTFCSPTMFVTGDGFGMEGMTVANDLSQHGRVRTQGVALSITADRAVLRHVRLLGAQDTLYAASPPCKAADQSTCKVSRQYFSDCFIEGEVDFIFGNSRAVFDRCEIHSIAHNAGGFLTAQSRNSLAQGSGYVFWHCRITAAAGVSKVYLGRPWRDFATVTFVDSELAGDIVPAGWSEWHPGETDRLKTARYAEFGSSGPGADARDREQYSRQLTAKEAEGYAPDVYLAGTDGWKPSRIR